MYLCTIINYEKQRINRLKVVLAEKEKTNRNNRNDCYKENKCEWH